MITIHHLGISQSERILWLFEELGLPYDLKRYDRDPKSRLAPPEYRALHPMGIAPVVTDGDVTLAESGAIIEYVIARHGGGRLAPAPGDAAFPAYLFWFHFANATLMAALMAEMAAAYMGQTDHPAAGTQISRVTRAYAAMEDRLGTAPYFAGDEFTAADIMMLFPLTTMRAFAPRDLGGFPNIRAYLTRIGERPAYQRAMAKGDPGWAPHLA